MSPAATIKLAVKVLEVVSLGLDVADKFVGVMKNAGVIKNTNTSEELGAKVLRGNELGLTPQNVKNWEDYEKYMRSIDAIELTAEQKYDADKKLAAANEFITGAMNLKYGQAHGVNNFLEEVNKNPDYYSGGRIEAYMDKAAQKNLNMENIGRYFDNKLDSLQDIRKTESVLLEAEKSLGVDESKTKSDFDAERVKRWQVAGVEA